jgi:hypothetical protein
VYSVEWWRYLLRFLLKWPTMSECEKAKGEIFPAL